MIDLALPPGWWRLPLASGAPPSLREELERLARIAAVGGAVLLAAGAAVDPVSGRLVTASLLVAPASAVDEPPPDGGPEGPRHTLRLPAGPAVRTTRLVKAPTPVGDLVEVCVDYRVAGWLLAFRTPALNHVAALLEAFDAIAATMRPAEPAFS